MAAPLLPARFLFRFSAPCHYCDALWPARSTRLDESHRLIGLPALEDRASWVDVRAGWSEAGLVFVVEVHGKRQAAWCRDSRVEDSDGLRLWIDTRDVHNVHRATRFCHQFIALPGGTGKNLDQAVIETMPINRARELPTPIRDGVLKARSERKPDGYRLEVFLPAEALTGFDPAEHPQLGFNYAVIDRELGEETFSAGSPMPYHEDPSLWATLELVK